MTELACHHYAAHRCMSCSLLELSSQAARERQQLLLEQTLGSLAPIRHPVWCRNPAGSRIRARLATAGTAQQPIFGFFNDRRQLVAADDCPLHHPQLTHSIGWLSDFVAAARLEPYSPETDRGEVKFVVLAFSPSAGQLMVQWVLRSREAIDRIRSVWRKLAIEQRGNVSVMSAGIQPKRSTQTVCEIDLPVSDEQMLRVTYQQPRLSLMVSPGGFVQTNYEIAGELYAAADRTLQDLHPRHVLDLYCGSGAFALLAARCGAKTLGVDVTASSIACANAAATEQHLPARFCQSPAAALQFDDLNEAFDVVICNPPRAGLDDATVELLRRLAPSSILYSSCNPATLARDLQRLSDQYQAEDFQPFEMFPGTEHWEVLCQARLRST
jgi:23S rRNA (uracil747-C5)-methyltransferase